MKKALVALSTAAIGASAMAQSNVTIYGVADVSVQGQTISQGQARAGGPDGTTTKIASNNSLLGFKGTEDLGNGNRALFQFETRINLNGSGTGKTTNNTGDGFSLLRESFVGLTNNKAGQIRLGYMNSAYKQVLKELDVFPGAAGDAQVSTVFGRTVAGAGVGSTVANYTMNQTAYVDTTAIKYNTPTFYGTNAELYYTGNGGNNNTNDQINTANVTTGVAPNSATGASLRWTGYGFGLDGAIHQASYTNAQGINATNLGSSTNYLVGAKYTGIPGLKVSVAYGRNALGLNANGNQDAQKSTSNSVFFGTSYRFGNNEPRFSYANTSNTSGLSSNNPTFSGQNGGSQFNLGWAYYLSKRTQVYGIVSQIRNNANGVYNFASTTGQGTNSLTGGEKLTTYGMGLRTNF